MDQIRVLFIGDNDLVTQLANDYLMKYQSKIIDSPLLEFNIKEAVVNINVRVMNITDQRFAFLRPIMLRESDTFVFVFDLNKASSLSIIRSQFIPQILHSLNVEQRQMILLGIETGEITADVVSHVSLQQIQKQYKFDVFSIIKDDSLSELDLLLRNIPIQLKEKRGIKKGWISRLLRL